MVCSDVLLVHHTRSISGKGLTSSHSRGEKEINLRVSGPISVGFRLLLALCSQCLPNYFLKLAGESELIWG